MAAWIIELYRFWAGRRLWLGAAAIGALSLALALTFQLKLDQSLGLLMPDGSPELKRAAGLMDLAPFARIILVQLTADDPEAAWELTAAAEDLAQGLDQNLLTLWLDPEAPPDPAGLLALLPALCDADCRVRLAASLTSDRLKARLDDLKKALAALGGEEELFWRADPGQWRAEVFSRLPRPRAEIRPDFLAGYPVSRDGRHLLMALKPHASMNDAAGAKAVLAHLDSLTPGRLRPRFFPSCPGPGRKYGPTSWPAIRSAGTGATC